MARCFLVCVTVLLVASTSVFAVTVETLNPLKDSGMYAAAGGGDSNRGDDGRFDIGIGPADDGGLIKFDLSSVVVPAGQKIVAATLQLKTASGSPYNFNMDVVAYPLVNDWQEGVGNSGVTGGTGFPWGPASVGDAVYNYAQVTAVGPGAAPFDTTLVATAGVPWNVAGGRGVGTDVLDRLMINETWVRAQAGLPVGTPFAPLTFTSVGLDVLNEWQQGTLDNHGFNIWSVQDNGSGSSARVGSSELVGAEPELILTIDVPEPATLAVLALGGLALLRRRRR